MATRLKTWSRFFVDRRAVTAIEYSMIAAILAAALIIVISNVGHGETGSYNTISSEL